MPRKTVLLFLALALAGAAVYVFFTFPRNRAEIPTSQNQRPFPSAPPPGPNGLPVPDTVPHPSSPKPPPGPTLRVMAWANDAEAQALRAGADAFTAADGRRVSLTLENPAEYRRDLRAAVEANSAPDVFLVDAAGFAGLDPRRDLAEIAPGPDDHAPAAARDAFRLGDRLCAAPAEFSVEMLFFNRGHFDRAGIGYPDRHWTWDILEAMTRALASLRPADGAGAEVHPLELPADLPFWNALCAEGGRPVLDANGWHLGADDRAAQVRALDLIHEMYQGLTVAAPFDRNGPGRAFARQEASLLVAPSAFAARLAGFDAGRTLLPADLARATAAELNGWAVSPQSAQPEAANRLALFLARHPVHAGWTSVQPAADGDEAAALAQEALARAVVPRPGPEAKDLVRFIDDRLAELATDPQQTGAAAYDRILAQYRARFPETVASAKPGLAPVAPKTPPGAELR